MVNSNVMISLSNLLDCEHSGRWNVLCDWLASQRQVGSLEGPLTSERSSAINLLAAYVYYGV